MKQYVCSICGYVYDEAAGIPEKGVAPGTRWEDLPDDWVCPLCGAPKALFTEKAESAPPQAAPAREDAPEALRELGFAELSALCSNLARGCEKQYLAKEAALFTELADYYKAQGGAGPGGFEKLGALVQKNLGESYPRANGAAHAQADRGALRALVWSEKVTRMLASLLQRYEREKGAFLESTNVYVCEICGFVYVGDQPPEICPVCKVPRLKIAQVVRR